MIRKTLFALMILFGMGSFAHAYELATHGRLTHEAYKRSVLVDDEFLSQLGIQNGADPFGNTYFDIAGERIEERTRNLFEQQRNRMPRGTEPLSIEGWLMRGAIREDDLGFVIVELPPTKIQVKVQVGPDPYDDPYGPIWRVMRHFYDPIHNNSALVLPPVAAELFHRRSGESTEFHSAPNWALGTQNAFTAPNTPETGRRNHFTILDAREAMYRALTGQDKLFNQIAGTEEERNKYWATTFRALGDVVHLIQDVAQPQHTRNDPHSGIPGLGDMSAYEYYVDCRATNSLKTIVSRAGAQGCSGLNYGGYPTPVFTKYSDFFSTREGPNGRGLADYSNRGFFSAGTNFGTAEGKQYPRPFHERQAYRQELVAFGTLLNDFNAPILEPLFILKADVPDTNNPAFSQNCDFSSGIGCASLTTEGLWRQPLAEFVSENIAEAYGFSLTRPNYDDAADLLIPRAVAYSAGIIDYFFRGRLEAEDAEFTHTGIRLRIKNAIDPDKTPEWVDEHLYAEDSEGRKGVFEIAYEYDDGSGEKQYGVSHFATLQDSEDARIAPGETSAKAYDFAFTLPNDAKKVKYRLVFRGKLGEEDDAVAVGAVDPASGFAVTPNYVPADGVAGTRMIYKAGNRWRLSDKKDVEAGNIDWKGQYQSGKPTRVLTYAGPASRYFPPSNGSVNTFGRTIYQHGEPFFVAPSLHDVLGAAITKDANGVEWVIAICRFGNADVVLRRPNKKNLSPAFFDPVIEPQGWRVLASFNVPDTFVADRPWFFNGSGTAAQTMRRVVTDNSAEHKLTRLKITITGEAAEIDNLGNADGMTTTATVNDSGWTGLPDRSQCGSEGRGAANRTMTTRHVLTGVSTVAVDYVDGDEKTAELAGSGEATATRHDHLEWSEPRCSSDSVITDISDVNTQLNIKNGFKATLMFEGVTVPVSVFDQKGTITTVTDFGSSIHWVSEFVSGTPERQKSATRASEGSSVRRTILHHLDLRHAFYAGADHTSSLNGSTVVNESQVCHNETGEFKEQTVLSHRSSSIVGAENTHPAPGGGCVVRTGNIPIGSAYHYSPAGVSDVVLIDEVSGAWGIDIDEHLLVSQETVDPAVWLNYFSDGDITALVPAAPASAIYGVGVIK